MILKTDIFFPLTAIYDNQAINWNNNDSLIFVMKADRGSI